MNGANIRRAASFFIVAILSSSAFAQAPSAHWRTITTKHFRVHYPVQYQEWAKLAAAHIESVRSAVVHEVGFSPEQVTDILVMNPEAEPNGETLPLLDRPRIILFTEPPPPESQIGEFSNWIDLLTVHEVAHLVHLLRPSRNPTRRLLGHLLPLNPITLAAPRWVLEGYATVVEGRLTGSGRPSSSYRAAILRKWAVSGRLPSYAELNGGRSFMGMSMAYLVGSAYLEWLEQRSGPESLRHLWARMTARQRRTFEQSFEGVFGDRPDRLYGTFTAELTERAMAVARAEEKSKREGELWQETTRDSGDPAVSPDGKQLAMVTRDAKHEARVVIFSTGPNEEEETYRKRMEKILKRDPEDVAPVRTKPLPRKPLHSLRPPDGGDIASPRWTRDGNSLLLTHSQPDREGFQHHDLFLWTPGEHRLRRLTHLADVEDADPLPDGKHAVAVRNRNGYSQLVTVELTTGEVLPYGEASIERIVSHPRASADGRITWSEHDGAGWHVAATRDAFSPEWDAAGNVVTSVARGGFIEIARGAAPLTRTFGAAVDPAPAPDGSLYFMSLEPDGFVVRHMPKEAMTDLPPLTFEQRLAPTIAETPSAAAVTFTSEPLAPPRDYGLGRQEFSTVFGGSWTAYGGSNEFGGRLGDVVGRLDMLALAATGSDSADRGGALAATWRGFPVAVTAHLFKLRERSGAEFHGAYNLHAPMRLLSMEAGGVAGDSRRLFASAAMTLRRRNSSATLRAAADSSRHARAGVGAAGRVGGVRLGGDFVAARRMVVGGVASSILPDAILLERIIDPALPLGALRGDRYHGARGELTLSGLTAFVQRHDLGAQAITVRGIEWTMHSAPMPLLQAAGFDLTLGAARVSDRRGTKGWLALRWRQ